MDYYARLIAARQAKKLTQEAVGKTFASNEKPAGLGKQTVSHWENGVNDLTVPQFLHLCDLYGVTAGYLLFGDASLNSVEESLLDEYHVGGDMGRTIIDSAVETSRKLRTSGDFSSKILAIVKK